MCGFFVFLHDFLIFENFSHYLSERGRDCGVADEFAALGLVHQLDSEGLQEPPELVRGQAVGVDLVARERLDDPDVGLAAEAVLDRLDPYLELMALSRELALPLHDASDEVVVELLGHLEDPDEFRLARLGLGECRDQGVPLALQLGRVGGLELVGERAQASGSLRPEQEGVQELFNDPLSKVFSQVGRGRVTVWA